MKQLTYPCGTCLANYRRGAFFLLLLTMIGFLDFSPPAAAAGAPQSATLFLPFKINAATDQANLTRQADDALEQAVGRKGLAIMTRSEAASKINYQQSWPPTVEAVMPLVSATSVNYVAVGSLTQLGEAASIDITVLDLLGQEPPRYFYQRSESAAGLNAALDRVIGDIMAYSEREFLIATIEIKGNRKTDSGAIMRHIKSQSGDRYASGQLREDLKNIFKMGYFEDVQIEVAESEQGKTVTFVVTEKALIGQVNLIGTKELDEKEVKEVVSVSPNTILNTKEVQNSVESIKKLYKEKGYYTTEVTAKLDYPKPDRVNIQFDIKEGVKVFIKEIRLVGNTAFSEKELKKVMATSEKGWLSWVTESGRLKRDILDQDRSRIGAFYHNNGYIEAQVGEAEVTREGEWLYVTFNIAEGDRYRVGTIDITGELVEDKNALLEQVKLGQEKFFSRQVLREDVLRLTDRYAEYGYAFAELNPRLQKNAEHKRMDVVIEASKGILVHVNRIVIKGNNRTRDKVIRREIRLKEGGIFDATAMRKSTEKLQRLDFFEEVNINPEPTVQDDLMDIIVDVKEKPTGTFSIGAGYSSVDNLSFMGEISQNNFMGKGQRLALQASLSSAATRFNLSFTEPRLDDSKLLFGFDAYNWRREYDDYTKDSTGGAVRFGYPIWEKWQAFWGYGFDDTQLSDLKSTAAKVIRDSADINTTSYVKGGVARDTRNKLYDASKGSIHNISVKHAGGVLGGDSSFTKWEGSTSWYFSWTEVPVLKEITKSWFKETVLHFKGAAGYAIENEEDKLPVYEKFYLGGLNTVRGFDSGKISPKDPGTGERIGGEKMWYMNAEWIFPIAQEIGLKGVAFFDAGNVYVDSDTWDIGDLKKAVGIGFRWLSPMGPLRLEWGYNIDPAPDEDQGVWDFSIGGTF